MKTNFALLLCSVLAAVFVGCATHRVDWSARIGTYTYDQAINELGPPDKQAKTTDGRTVAEWITRYYANNSVIVSSGFYGRSGGVSYIQPLPNNTYEDSLRLMFTTNNILSSWTKH